MVLMIMILMWVRVIVAPNAVQISPADQPLDLLPQMLCGGATGRGMPGLEVPRIAERSSRVPSVP